MYRLVLYCLKVIALCTIVLSFFGLVPFSPLELITSLIVIAFVTWSVNVICSKILRVPTNVESYAITGLILFLILSPGASVSTLTILVIAGVVAILSKYILVIHHTHIANPAAFGAFALSLVGLGGGVSWWVGMPVLTPVVAICGLLIVRKIRRAHVFFAFLFTSLATTVVGGLLQGNDIGGLLSGIIIGGTLMFFGTVMLTEPLTMPSRRLWQIVYGCIVGVLFSSGINVGSWYMTPELSLIVGNVVAFAVSPKFRLKLSLKKKRELAPDIYEFEFLPSNTIPFHAGQYLEWTLAHDTPDARGNRRYFTIASSPTESTIKIGVRMAQDRSSTFKHALQSISEGDVIFASHVAGDFVLPPDSSQKVVFIAGGIGVTPYRSMIQYLVDTNDNRDTTLFYATNNAQSFVYSDVFNQAQQSIGLRMVQVLSGAKDIPQGWTGEVGYITADMIKKYVPAVHQYTFYLSGPHGMVEAYKKMLTDAEVPLSHIRTDYFPGF